MLSERSFFSAVKDLYDSIFRKGDSLRDSLLDSYSFNNNIIREDECEAPSGCLRSFALRHGELIDRGFQRQSPNGCVHIAKRGNFELYHASSLVTFERFCEPNL